MHPLEKLWNIATGLQKANPPFEEKKARMEKTMVKLGIDQEFHWVGMMQDINTALKTGETLWDYWNEDDADSWLMPPDAVAAPIPDFTQPPPNINSVTGEILDEPPTPKKRTKATAKADDAKLIIMRLLSLSPDRWFSVIEIGKLFDLSERTIRRYMEDLYEKKQVTRKNQYQRIRRDREILRHLYKFCPTTS